MLTFAEFFTKKKIDIGALQIAEPDLYNEFYRDYSLMGEKSFDHSKKYWFNKLRKHYILDEITISEEGDVIETKDEQFEHPTQSTVTAGKPAGFKPRFKAAVKPKEQNESNTPAPQTTDENASEQQEPEAKTIKPAGFKPRFKPKTTINPKNQNNEN